MLTWEREEEGISDSGLKELQMTRENSSDISIKILEYIISGSELNIIKNKKR
jgi:hypothetical protein